MSGVGPIPFPNWDESIRRAARGRAAVPDSDNFVSPPAGFVHKASGAFTRQELSQRQYSYRTLCPEGWEIGESRVKVYSCGILLNGSLSKFRDLQDSN